MQKALVFNLQKFSIHDGAGIRTDVFFQGCNLRCKWCANPESQPMEPLPGESAKAYTVDELVEELLKDKPFYDESGGGVTLTGGEALLHPEFVLELTQALHREGVHVAVETAACVSEDVFARVLAAVDFAYIDLKHYDDTKHREGTGVGNELILRNIAAALKGKTPVVVRIPVIPGYNDSEANFEGFAKTLTALGAKDVQLLPFHQLGESKYRRLNLDYAYDGTKQLHDGDVSAFAAALTRAGLNVQIGG
ncbi:MAG: glycyl-radical enzyme activating protein [Clostridiales bacterium]|nr:glycyl-radical enzyme activating protein [Clostridiales bacterium]